MNRLLIRIVSIAACGLLASLALAACGGANDKPDTTPTSRSQTAAKPADAEPTFDDADSREGLLITTGYDARPTDIPLVDDSGIWFAVAKVDSDGDAPTSSALIRLTDEAEIDDAVGDDGIVALDLGSDRAVIAGPRFAADNFAITATARKADTQIRAYEPESVEVVTKIDALGSLADDDQDSAESTELTVTAGGLVDDLWVGSAAQVAGVGRGEPADVIRVSRDEKSLPLETSIGGRADRVAFAPDSTLWLAGTQFGEDGTVAAPERIWAFVGGQLDPALTRAASQAIEKVAGDRSGVGDPDDFSPAPTIVGLDCDSQGHVYALVISPLPNEGDASVDEVTATVVRLTSNGSLDSSWGEGGSVVLPLPLETVDAFTESWELDVHPAGRVLVGASLGFENEPDTERGEVRIRAVQLDSEGQAMAGDLSGLAALAVDGRVDDLGRLALDGEGRLIWVQPAALGVVVRRAEL